MLVRIFQLSFVTDILVSSCERREKCLLKLDDEENEGLLGVATFALLFIQNAEGPNDS